MRKFHEKMSHSSSNSAFTINVFWIMKIKFFNAFTVDSIFAHTLTCIYEGHCAYLTESSTSFNKR